MNYILAVGRVVFWYNEDSWHGISGSTSWSFVWEDVWTNDTEAFVVCNDGDKTLIAYGSEGSKKRTKSQEAKKMKKTFFPPALVCSLPPVAVDAQTPIPITTAAWQKEGPANVDGGILNYGKCVRIDYFIKTSFFISTNFSPSFPSAFMR